ncbi:hypothetical protein FB567DRAFT_216878 [Paraphoma chrysanthemicola]|uniref:Uncharacterized protein n=1 Tax=Paraphoma chrysanthemicola TaxID=798071 RepID=A0A8K0VSB6_9PLEO|nr:hypothetical protein FB567DRAFT_216878 [Paraphoma chrysanthemicola]
MTKDEPQRDISRSNLKTHGITFDTRIIPIHELQEQSTARALPEHIAAVGEALLTFENIIPQGWKRHLEKEAATFNYESPDLPGSTFVSEEQFEIDLGEHSQEWLLAHQNLKYCNKVAKDAQKLIGNQEPEWSLFWRNEVFVLFNTHIKKQRELCSRLDAWSLYESITWSEYENAKKEVFLGKPRTTPKPDLTYAFPIKSHSTAILRGLARDEISKALSPEVLGQLLQQGITCTPTTGLRNWTKAQDKTKMLRSDSDRSCFPWAIVEMKRDVSTVDGALAIRCYCQAANAAAAALDLQAQLFDKLDHDRYSQNPPIVVITTVGPEIRVWLAYWDRDSHPLVLGTPKQRMVCIWSTSALLTWGIASIRAVIMNMQTWATRLLKPKIQHAIVEALRRGQRPTKVGSQESSSANNPFTFASSSIFTPTSSPLAEDRAGDVRRPSRSPPATPLAIVSERLPVSTTINQRPQMSPPEQLRRGIESQHSNVLPVSPSPMKRKIAWPCRKVISKNTSDVPSLLGTNSNQCDTRTSPGDMVISQKPLMPLYRVLHTNSASLIKKPFSVDDWAGLFKDDPKSQISLSHKSKRSAEPSKSLINTSTDKRQVPKETSRIEKDSSPTSRVYCRSKSNGQASGPASIATTSAEDREPDISAAEQNLTSNEAELDADIDSIIQDLGSTCIGDSDIEGQEMASSRDSSRLGKDAVPTDKNGVINLPIYQKLGSAFQTRCGMCTSGHVAPSRDFDGQGSESSSKIEREGAHEDRCSTTSSSCVPGSRLDNRNRIQPHPPSSPESQQKSLFGSFGPANFLHDQQCAPAAKESLTSAESITRQNSTISESLAREKSLFGQSVNGQKPLFGQSHNGKSLFGRSSDFTEPDGETRSQSSSDSNYGADSSSQSSVDEQDIREYQSHSGRSEVFGIQQDSDVEEYSESEDHEDPEDYSDREERSDAEDSSDADYSSDSDDELVYGDYNLLDGTAPIKAVITVLTSQPRSGEWRMERSMLRTITSDLSCFDRLAIEVLVDRWKNPDGSCRVPLESALRVLRSRLERRDD